MLRAAPHRVDALLDSAVRAGAQTALMMVKSWYPGLDLQALTGLRAGSEPDIAESWPAICHQAAEIRGMVKPDEYTRALLRAHLQHFLCRHQRHPGGRLSHDLNLQILRRRLRRLCQLGCSGEPG